MSRCISGRVQNAGRARLGAGKCACDESASRTVASQMSIEPCGSRPPYQRGIDGNIFPRVRDQCFNKITPWQLNLVTEPPQRVTGFGGSCYSPPVQRISPTYIHTTNAISEDASDIRPQVLVSDVIRDRRQRLTSCDAPRSHCTTLPSTGHHPRRTIHSKSSHHRSLFTVLQRLPAGR